MKHALANPAFPDLVGEWAKAEADKEAQCSPFANDNPDLARDELGDPLLALVARAEVEATRLW